MGILEFFQDYENSFSQKRLQVFLAFVVAVILVFNGYDAEYIGLFLGYGSLNAFASTTETKYLNRCLHE